MPLSQGQVLNNRYRIVQLLGQGGFGAVYRAWDMNLNTSVALKENLNTSTEAVRQFEREARLLANLRHQSLPYVIDHFSLLNQGQYMVMEFIEGQDLQKMIEHSGRGLPEAQVLPWFLQACDALIYLHTQSAPIIHRDIKPANIKITPQGQAILVDFGIAKVFQPGSKTTIGARAVTQGYSPPEQYGGGMTDARSDVYALGATIYAVLTGLTPTESLQRQLGHPLPAPSQVNPSITPGTERAILRAMNVELGSRYQSMAEFKKALVTPIPATQFSAQPLRPSPVYVAPTQAAPGAAQQYISSPAVETNIPSKTQPRKLTWVAIAGFLSLCLIGGLLAGIGIYAVVYAPGGWFSSTSTNMPHSVAQATTRSPATQTGTLAPTLTSWLSETPSPSPIPSSTWTLTSWPSPSPSNAPTVNATWQPCPAGYPSRLHVGDNAKVSSYPAMPNRVRDQPNTSSTILGLLQVDEKMVILNGPVCFNNWIWWYVRSLSTNLTGWTAEGDETNYWLVPAP
jgi:serine/threonine protein kinase